MPRSDAPERLRAGEDEVKARWPWGVDVATGVETAPGHKDRDAIIRFIARARAAATAA